MNLILLQKVDLTGPATAVVSGRRAEHILQVLKCGVGDAVLAGLLDGPMGTARVGNIDSEQVTLALDLGAPPPRPRVTMILAMVRPQIMKRTLQHLATLGVRRILLIGGRRVEKSYFSQRLFDGDQYKEHLFLGLEQARDTWLPEVTIHRRFKPFVEDLLPPLLEGIPNRVLAHPDASGRVDGKLPQAAAGEVALAVGPEGGFVDYEVERFVDLGFEPISLGRRILKVETAVPYLFGALGL